MSFLIPSGPTAMMPFIPETITVLDPSEPETVATPLPLVANATLNAVVPSSPITAKCLQ